MSGEPTTAAGRAFDAADTANLSNEQKRHAILAIEDEARAAALDVERLAAAMHETWAGVPGLGDRPDIWQSLGRETAKVYARLAAEPTDA